MINRVTFSNDIGTFEAGTSSVFDNILQGIEGLGVPEKDYATTKLIDFDGQKTLSSRVLPRQIVMSFYMIRGNLARKTNDLMRIFNKGGVLTLYFDTSSKIIVNQVEVDYEPDFKRLSRKFTLKMTCDYPYFTDLNPIKLNVFSKEKMLEGNADISVPTEWTKLTDDADIYNEGEATAYPTIYIYDIGASGIENDTRLKGIKFEKLDANDNVLQVFEIEKTTTDGEIIEIQLNANTTLGRRYIKSNIEGDITNKRTDESFLNGLFFERGNAKIKVTNYNVERKISCQLLLDNYYISRSY